MKCGMCKIETKGRLCNTCKEYLEWIYPNEEAEVIMKKYKELSKVHYFLKSKRRGGKK
jgi:hypothetical protein